MIEMTPKTLREALHCLERYLATAYIPTKVHADELEMADKLANAAASAWEADLQHLRDEVHLLVESGDARITALQRNNDTLRARIEALVRISEHHTDAASIWDVVFLKSAILSLAVGTLGEDGVRAALAAEEKKP